MNDCRKILSWFKPPTRATRRIVKELRRTWAKLDGRAATIRRLSEQVTRQQDALTMLRVELSCSTWRIGRANCRLDKIVADVQRMTEEIEQARQAMRTQSQDGGEAAKLRDAIKRAGFAVCQSAGDWTIHDVSEYAKAGEEKVAAVISRNIDLEVENERLRDQLPASMPNCKIEFKECEQGHGRLTATNWIDHGCPHCENERLRDLLKHAPLCQACLGNPMVQECQPWCREAQKIKRADEPTRNP
jgi:regulator of replication initiation timing